MVADLAIQLENDPTGLSSPVGRIVILLALVASLVVTLRWWWQQRKR